MFLQLLQGGRAGGRLRSIRAIKYLLRTYHLSSTVLAARNTAKHVPAFMQLIFQSGDNKEYIHIHISISPYSYSYLHIHSDGIGNTGVEWLGGCCHIYRIVQKASLIRWHLTFAQGLEGANCVAMWGKCGPEEEAVGMLGGQQGNKCKWWWWQMIILVQSLMAHF